MKLLILVATPKELRDFNLETHKDVKVIFTGIGKLNAFSAVRSALLKEDFDAVLNIGTCGSDKHPVGTILHPSVIKQGDAFILHGFSNISFVVNGDPEVSILNGDNFINKQPDENGNLSLPEPMRNFDAYDMESYAIAFAAAPFLSNVHFLKIVSDNLDGSLADWEKSADALAKTLCEATEDFIRKNFISDYSL